MSCPKANELKLINNDMLVSSTHRKKFKKLCVVSFFIFIIETLSLNNLKMP